MTTLGEWLKDQCACTESRPLWEPIADVDMGVILAHLTPLGICLIAQADGSGPMVDVLGWMSPLHHIRGVDLRCAYLRGANLCDALAARVDLRGADLGYADMSGMCLLDADLRGADLRHAFMLDAETHGADLRGARRHHADDPITGWIVVGGRLERGPA